ncbi:hypothetical protein DYE50_11375 [Treponema ruminis]|uniref:Lipoprotein n=1 Tax=Treponema ruminis TaxID=744515 RepID=A0A7W8LLY9_9SPIR|nr:hypothetical protein [Treponema ruminis]MBB5225919.1 hypothetical protein [Treponema ruminis]QSI03168.1 hypothetical protein DYE50_11375 [Treponema ruminis]
MIKKIVLIFIPMIFVSCAAFLNEKFSAAENLSESFNARIKGISVVSFSAADDISLATVTGNDSVKLTASTGFTSYSWTVDEKSVAGSENEISIKYDNLEGGWHLATVITCDADGNYFSASTYFQVMSEKRPVGSGVTTNFDRSDSESISMSYTNEGNLFSFTATKGFSSYAWMLDAAVLAESESSAVIDLSTLTAGTHIVTVIAKNEAGIYYSANAQIEKQTTVEPEILCSGITTVLDSESRKSFSVTSLAGAKSVSFTATSGFESYSWTLDGSLISGSGNTASLVFEELSIGWHNITVTASTSDGFYYSASMQVQKTGSTGATDVQLGAIGIGFAKNTDALSITAKTSASQIILTATNGLDGYAWTVDGVSLSGNANTETVAFAQLSAGWHVITVTAHANDGVYYSAAMQIQKKTSAGIADIQTGKIHFDFAENSVLLSINSENSASEVSLTASSGFESYAWTLDGVAITGNANTAIIELVSRETGWHFVTVTAVKDGIYYSAYKYIQKKGA